MAPKRAKSPAKPKKAPARKPKVAAEDMPLGDAEKEFVLRYMVHFNGTKAAIEAGYAEKSAAVTASRLLRKANIIKQLDNERAARKERLRMDADDLLGDLVEEARADIADIHTPDGALKPIDEWPMVWRRGLVAGIEIVEEYDDASDEEREPQAHGGALKRQHARREAIGRTVKIKLASRQKTREMIGKHVGVNAFKEVKEHTVPEDSPIAKLFEQIAGSAIRPDGDDD